MKRVARIGIPLIALFLLVPGVASAADAPPAGAPAPQTYSKDLYASSGVRYQDPDFTACVAASTEMMLNMIATNGSKGDGFRWVRSTSFVFQERILAWERAHHTQVSYHPGVDPHGWRNGLNYFGWGAYTDARKAVYQDLSFLSYSAAVKGIVRAIARYDKPVAILGWAGGHAQFITGYVVTGQDPALSSDFTVDFVYLTDPLRADGKRDAKISDKAFRSGPSVTRFRPYAFTDSPRDDPYTAGTRTSYREWFGLWVIVAPVR